MMDDQDDELQNTSAQQRIVEIDSCDITHNVSLPEEILQEFSESENEGEIQIKNNKTPAFSLQELCRICAKPGEDMEAVFGVQQLHKKINLCLPIIVNESDSLPLNVCHFCVSRLEQTFDLVTQTQRSDLLLKILVQRQQSFENGENFVKFATPPNEKETQELKKQSVRKSVIVERICDTYMIPKHICDTDMIPKRICEADMIPKRICDANKIPKRICDADMIPKRICEADMIPKRICEAGMIPKSICEADMIPKRICDADMIPKRICEADMIPQRICDIYMIAEHNYATCSRVSTPIDPIDLQLDVTKNVEVEVKRRSVTCNYCKRKLQSYEFRESHIAECHTFVCSLCNQNIRGKSVKILEKHLEIVHSIPKPQIADSLNPQGAGSLKSQGAGSLKPQVADSLKPQGAGSLKPQVAARLKPQTKEQFQYLSVFPAKAKKVIKEKVVCNKCGNIYSTLKRLQLHTCVPHFTCKNCRVRFLHEDKFINHTCKRKQKFSCTDCYKIFRNKTKCTNHLCNNGFVCKYCKKIINNKHKLNNHSCYILKNRSKKTNKIKIASKEDLFSCSKCQEEFNTLEKIEEHYVKNTKNLCESCFKIFKTEFGLKAHICIQNLSSKINYIKIIEKNLNYLTCNTSKPQYSNLKLINNDNKLPNIAVISQPIASNDNNIPTNIAVISQPIASNDSNIPTNIAVISQPIASNDSNIPTNIAVISQPIASNNIKSSSYVQIKPKSTVKVAEPVAETENATNTSLDNEHAPNTITCNDCLCVFESNEIFQTHKCNFDSESEKSIKTFKPPVNHGCNICFEVFNRKFLLKNHLKDVHSVYLCVNMTCYEYFDSQKAANRHKRLKHSPFRLCEICDKSFPTFTMYKEHIYYVHSKGENKYKCAHCDSSYKHRQKITNHIVRKHLNAEVKKCPHCNKEYRSEYDLKIHVYERHKEKKFLCQDCGQSFTYKHDFDIHNKSVHIDFRQFICKICKQEFNCIDNVKRHVENRHSEREIIEIRSKIYYTIKSPYQCKICLVYCKNYFAMNKHIKLTHKLYRSYYNAITKDQIESRSGYSEEDNKKRKSVIVNRLAELQKRKKRIRAPGVPKSCPICGKVCKNASGYKIHMYIHESGEIFKCSECGKTCVTLSQLKKHQKYHEEGRNMYYCNFCGEQFITKLDVDRHINLLHRSHN